MICSVFDLVSGSLCKMQLLRMNTNDDYNNNINIYDIHDHI